MRKLLYRSIHIIDEDYDETIAEKEQIKTIHEPDSAVITSKPGESGGKSDTKMQNRPLL